MLEERILAGDPPPGEPLREEALAGELGISRHTLRETLQLLSQRGLVERQPFRGARVRLPSVAEVAEIFRIRGCLESQGLQAALERPRAAESALAPVVEALERAADATRVDDGSVLFLVDRDLEFHRGLVDQLESPRLADFFFCILRELRLALVLVDLRTARDSATLSHVPEHRLLLRHIAAGDRNAATVLLESHLADAEDRLVSQLREAAEASGRASE